MTEPPPHAPPEPTPVAKPKIKKPPVLFSKTQKIVKQITEQVDGVFITYWHAPAGSVCQNDVLGLFEVLERLGPQERIYLYIKSGGGDGMASLRIVNLLRRYTKRLVAMLSLECASAATMIALGADEIQMGPLAYLTAVDTSLVHELSPVDVRNRRVRVSLDELTRFVELWRRYQPEDKDRQVNPYEALTNHVHPLVVGAVERSSSLSVKLCTEILSFHVGDRERAEEVAVHLNESYPAHRFPILMQEAQRIGLAASDLSPELNARLLDLHVLYSEMGQQAITDVDPDNYHNNEIVNIIEADGIQVFYQNDKDWHFSGSEKQWIGMNDKSSWRKIERVGNKVKRSVFHIR